MPDDFMLVLRPMVSFRNRMVHIYWDVDEEIVFQALQDGIKDLDRFATLISDYLAGDM